MGLAFHIPKQLYKREYNSERRRKHRVTSGLTIPPHPQIRENITPRGDGNSLKDLVVGNGILHKREYNSERRRKLLKFLHLTPSPATYKREYNSERRRKLYFYMCKHFFIFIIRENITPRGDGNNFFKYFLKNKFLK